MPNSKNSIYVDHSYNNWESFLGKMSGDKTGYNTIEKMSNSEVGGSGGSESDSNSMLMEPIVWNETIGKYTTTNTAEYIFTELTKGRPGCLYVVDGGGARYEYVTDCGWNDRGNIYTLRAITGDQYSPVTKEYKATGNSSVFELQDGGGVD
ncbi:MAG: hypothetical protein K6C34_00800 [Alphaproteobacteria bacterium]|nr:hypothetical protein [Alphaproteobacteria bacterium]